MMCITDEQWIAGLTQFYYDCVNHWRSFLGLGEDDCIRLAISDCLVIDSWPFCPELIEMPEEIKAWYHTWLRKDKYFLEPISRAGVNKILEKLPDNEYWTSYKAFDD